MIRPTLVVARRDLVATVFTRGFLVWLAMPLVGILFGVIASLLAAGDRPAPRPVAVIDAGSGLTPWLAGAADAAQARTAYARARARHRALHPDEPLPPELAALPEDIDPGRLDEFARRGGADRPAGVEFGLDGAADAAGTRLVFVTAAHDRAAQLRRLLAAGRFDSVLLLDAGAARLVVAPGAAPDVDAVARLVNEAHETRALRSAGLSPRLDELRRLQRPLLVEHAAGARSADRSDDPQATLGRAVAVILFMLIGLLAGALLSNMVEEKANKVIEVLAASVPIPAIFAGKLLAMLGVSAIGILLWTTVIGGAVAAALADVPAGALPQPAVGWTALLLLALAYLVTAYLIYGAVYLGIGSLCASIREVQSLSLPVTIVQAMVLLGVMGALGRPEGAWAAVMSWFPLSSPYMMAARAAIEPGIARHVAALLWQLVFAAVVIWFSARLFRYGVLASAPVSPWRLLRRQKSSLS